VLLALLTLLTGVVYPLAVTGVGRLAFHRQATGSLIRVGGRTVGSRLIGQPFDDPRYFWGRLSATGPVPYNGAASSGSNLGPLNPALVDAVRGRIAALRAADSTARGPVPVDLVTASGSGLDPHISPAAAEYQVTRVARARGMTAEQVRSLVLGHTSGRTWRVLGEPVVNVLELNLALDERRGSGPQ
jgi:K+-transporting ATPase ATPase C chain